LLLRNILKMVKETIDTNETIKIIVPIILNRKLKVFMSTYNSLSN
jgi:hypothetical protein